MPRKSPFDVRSVDPKIVAIVIHTLRDAGGTTSYETLDEAVRQAAVAREIRVRSSRRTRDSDELQELEWLSVITRDEKLVRLAASEELVAELESDLEKTLAKLLFSRELLYHLLIRYLRDHGEASEKEIIDHMSSFDLDGRKYVDYGVEATPSVPVRFNQAKLSYLIRLGRKLGQLHVKKIAPNGRRVILLSQPVGDPKAAIVAVYRERVGSKTFVTIDEIWRAVQRDHPGVTETVFDRSLLQLRDEFYPSVDLFQGSGRKFVFDAQLGKYYHHVRMDPETVDSILKYLGQEE